MCAWCHSFCRGSTIPEQKLSATTITRLKGIWAKEYEAWNCKSLADKHYINVWADGVYCNLCLEGKRQCILVRLGATANGRKELLTIQNGQRESEQSCGRVCAGQAP